MKPVDRYGSPRRLPQLARIGIGAGVMIALGLVLWAAWGYATTPARSQVVSFTAESERSMLVRYQLTRRDADQTIRCRIEAQDYDRNVVGEITDVIPGGLGTLTRTVSVPTRLRAVAAVVEACRP